MNTQALTPASPRGCRRARGEGARVAGEGGERGGVAPHAAVAVVAGGAVVAVQQRRRRRGRPRRVARRQAVGVGGAHESGKREFENV